MANHVPQTSISALWCLGLVILIVCPGQLWPIISEKGPTITSNIISGIFHPNLETLLGLGERRTPLAPRTAAIILWGTISCILYSFGLSRFNGHANAHALVITRPS